MNKSDGSYPILVYQMGKTGGKTVEALLRSHNLQNQHVHFLDWRTIEKYEKLHFTICPNEKMQPSLRQSRWVRGLIDRMWGQVRWKIITAVREPVAKQISSGFQNEKNILIHRRDRTEDRATAEITQFFLKEFSKFDEAKNAACTWFDKELKDVFGFDVFSVDFNKSVGYQIYEAANADILVLKLEKLSDCCRDAFREFLGIDDFQLTNANVTVEKPYGQLYRRVLESISVPEADLDKIYASRYCRHFYTEEEISGFKKRWTKNTQRKEWLCTTRTRGTRCLSADGSRSTMATST